MTHRYVVEVDYATSKDTLKVGEVVAGTAFVHVLATSWHEATLIATQMVACTVEPTDTRLLDFPIGDSEKGEPMVP